ncbi:unnamed protein product [marine sediment metagenome]|uniref:Uncharacterized protein n=1 Tax=marine sediment metagenome TaxID=412755 RepID=X0XUV8_9ZZZZ
MTAKDWYDMMGIKSPEEKRKEQENRHPSHNGWHSDHYYPNKPLLSTGPYSSVDEDGNEYFELP